MFRVYIREYEMNDLPFIMLALKEQELAERFSPEPGVWSGEWREPKNGQCILRRVRMVQLLFKCKVSVDVM